MGKSDLLAENAKIETCFWELKPHLGTGTIALDAFAYECQNCGYTQISLDIPVECPGCHRQVVTEESDAGEK